MSLRHLRDQRQYQYEYWLDGIQREHPGCEIQATRYGCTVYDGDGEIVTEYDYEPDPYAEQRVRY